MKNLDFKDDSRWDGKYYAHHSDWQFRLASTALQYIRIPSNAMILDIGCGDGRFTKKLANLAFEGKVLGLDKSPLMVSAAQAHATSNLSFILGNAENLPFKNQFNYVVAFNSLHWVIDIKLALKQIYNVLVPGGYALILVAPIQVRHPIHRIIDSVAKQDRWHHFFDNIQSIFPFQTLGNWANAIESAKLIPERLELIDGSSDYTNKEIFANWIMGWIPFGSIPENRKREFVNEVVEAYITIIPCDSNGIIHYRMDELIIVASKSAI